MKRSKEDNGQLRGSPRGSIIPPPRGPEPEFKHHLQGGVWAFRPSPTHRKMIMTFVGYQQNTHTYVMYIIVPIGITSIVHVCLHVCDQSQYCCCRSGWEIQTAANSTEIEQLV